MVLDTSALLALLLDEPEAEAFRAAVVDDPTRLVSAGTLLETAVVIEARKGAAGGRELDALIRAAHVEVVAVDADLCAEARRAYRQFGRGHHPAALLPQFTNKLEQRRGEVGHATAQSGLLYGRVHGVPVRLESARRRGPHRA